MNAIAGTELQDILMMQLFDLCNVGDADDDDTTITPQSFAAMCISKGVILREKVKITKRDVPPPSGDLVASAGDEVERVPASRDA